MSRGGVRENQLLLNRQYDAVRTRIDYQGDWEAGELPVDLQDCGAAKKSDMRWRPSR